MKSPFTGKEMKIVYESRTWKFRGEDYEYVQSFWLCQDSGETFTTDEQDDAAFMQVTNQYRTKYGIPFTDEIVSIRERYGVSAAKMSQILGIGTNQWRHYEAGEVPNVSNGRMIRSIMSPDVFMGYVYSSKHILEEKEYKKLLSKIEKFVDENNSSSEREMYDFTRIYQSERGAENGYAPQSLSHLKNVLLYLLSRCGEVFYTKMNKILFYADFLSYRRRGMAITGLCYKAIEYGPVPERWDRVYSHFDEIIQEPRAYGEKEGTVLISVAEPDKGALSDAEMDILNEVCDKFSSSTSSGITEISHKEQAWLNHVTGHQRIPYTDAYTLNAI